MNKVCDGYWWARTKNRYDGSLGGAKIVLVNGDCVLSVGNPRFRMKEDYEFLGNYPIFNEHDEKVKELKICIDAINGEEKDKKFNRECALFFESALDFFGIKTNNNKERDESFKLFVKSIEQLFKAV